MDYLAEVSLLTDQDNENEADGSKVTLMTIHSAKGLEFKNVFVVGLEENLFPSPMSLDSLRGLEEERRLFYVAITRAEEHCFLSFAKSRFKFGKTEFSNPSRFLKDIDICYLRMPQEAVYARQIEQGASQFRAGVSEYANRYAKPERPKVELIRPSVPRHLTKVSSTASRPADVTDCCKASCKSLSCTFCRGKSAHTVRIEDCIVMDFAPVEVACVYMGINHTRCDCKV